MIIAPNNGLGSIWLGITWSLAIEEQFYLTAPILIHKLSRRILANVLFLFLVLGVICRFMLLQYPQGDFYSYVFTFTRLDGLILGVLSALLFRSSFKLRLIDLNEKALALLVFMVPLGIAVDVFRVFRPIKCLSYLFLSIRYTAFLLIAITHSSNVFSRITQSRLLQHIGLLAYGLYIFHSGINGLIHLFILEHDPALHSWKDVLVTVLSLIIVYGIARISWAFIELPMIQLGHRTEYQLIARRELSLT